MQTPRQTIDSTQFSEAEWKRLIDYVALLIDIDRKNKSKKGEGPS